MTQRRKRGEDDDPTEDELRDDLLDDPDEDDLLDEEITEEDESEEKTPVWVSISRIVSVVLVIVAVLLVLGFLFRGCKSSPIEPPVPVEMMDSMAQAVKPAVQPEMNQQPAAPTPQQAVETPQPTPMPSEGTIFIARYVNVNGEVKNGASTTLLYAEGKPIQIDIKGDGNFYEFPDYSPIFHAGKLVAVEVGHTVYAIDEETAKTLALDRGTHQSVNAVKQACYHRIQSGENARTIAANHGMNVPLLKTYNRSKDLNYLIAGERLTVYCGNGCAFCTPK